MIINTHYDHKSSEAREKQSRVLMEFIKGITDYPIVLTGDFNCLDSTSEYSTIVKNGMTNSYSLADKKINNVATYTNYGASNKIIDFVFVTAKKIAVTQYQVCNEKINGDFPSDHHPVLIEYAILG
jgi:endonuclease/exonuclease/phosphatase family metal-dependent hydrolase